MNKQQILVAIPLSLLVYCDHLNLYAQSQTGPGQFSNVTNNASPSSNVSTNANGGTQINQQLNNVFDTSFGFGPGIICRTPQFLVNGNVGSTTNGIDAYPIVSGTNSSTSNYSGNIAIAVPFGSSAIADCNRYVKQIAQDRVISAELSLLRACAQLKNEKIEIDPIKYPNLAQCINKPQGISSATPRQSVQSSVNTSIKNSSPTEPPNMIQRFNP